VADGAVPAVPAHCARGLCALKRGGKP
jgi:hypothetical protein